MMNVVQPGMIAEHLASTYPATPETAMLEVLLGLAVAVGVLGLPWAAVALLGRPWRPRR